ncbi:cytochrome bc complex cytochrome b subunit [Streptomyces sp. NPDC059740]|uniref:cytochrome bc1 complex cytochrome b subunit n=1 Tax=Streptomyces sp. NPDC059740 TaxID=3346926 RepID=UPI0036542B82
MSPSRRVHRLGREARQATETATTVLDRRMPLIQAGRLLRKAFPDHWSFLLGELALYSFVVLLLTGVYLTLFFKAGMTESVYQGAYAPLRGVRVTDAFSSTLEISFEVRGGLLARQIHHWAALLFLSAIGLHLLRIFFTGAFRRPREVNWTIGVTLFVLSLLEGFAGYSLPDDLLSGTGLRTAQGFVLSVPVLGTYLSFFLFGGQFPGDDIVARLYPVHILLLPGALIALLTVHLFLVFYLKHTQYPGPGATGRNVVGKALFPQYTAKSVGLFLLVFGVLAVLGAVGQINPVWNYGPYRPDQVSTGAQPDWYVGFLEGAIRLMPGAETRLWGHTVNWNPLLPSIVLPTLFFLALYAYPLFERWVSGETGEHHLADRPRNQPTRTALGVAALTWYAVLLVAGAQDVVAKTFSLSVEGVAYTLRTLFFLAPLLAFLVTKRCALALQDSDRERWEEGVETGWVRQSVAGGYAQGRTVVPAREVPLLLARRLPEPPSREAIAAAVTRRERLRGRLARWYFVDRVDLPVTPAQRRAVEQVTADPTVPAGTER